ncbi:adenylyltransferase/cytidyltransferase family protein [Candidatus Saccharibacteria bacterium]|nr:adenylyltransferase/cytidyltransferase family protein [Candidatus Saccharibacteria bacterium]
MIIGYTQGTYDLFHIGHLNLLENAKKQCDKLIVGINSDNLVKEYKNKIVNIHDVDRARIVGALKCVDEVHVVDTLDKLEALRQFNFDVIFIGSDWKGNPRWEQTKKDLEAKGKKLIFLPHTDGISTTDITAQVKANPVYVGLAEEKPRKKLLRRLSRKASLSWSTK